MQMKEIDWNRVWNGLSILTTPHPAFNNHAPCPVLGPGLQQGKITVTEGTTPVQDATKSKQYITDNNLWGHCWLYHSDTTEEELNGVCEVFDDKELLFLYMHPKGEQHAPIKLTQPYPMLIVQHRKLLKTHRERLHNYPYTPDIDLD